MPMQGAVGLDDNAVDRAHFLCHWAEHIHERQRRQLMGEGDVAACYAQCPEPQDGSLYVVWLHGEVAIGPVDTVRFDPVVVDDRRARLVDGHAHDASQFERNVVGHGLRAVFSSSFK